MKQTKILLKFTTTTPTTTQARVKKEVAAMSTALDIINNRVKNQLKENQQLILNGSFYSDQLTRETTYTNFSAVLTNNSNCKLVKKELNNLLADIAQNSVTKEEIQKSIAKTKTELAIATDSPSALMYIIGTSKLTSNLSVEELGEIIEKSRELTPADIQHVTKKYLSEPLSSKCITNTSETEEQNITRSNHEKNNA